MTCKQYIWHWTNGGFNWVWAISKSDAMVKAKKLSNTLKVDQATLHVAKPGELSRAYDSYPL